MAMQPGESIEAYNRRMNAEAEAAWHRSTPNARNVPMPHVSQMIQSKYVGHAEVVNPVVVTIKDVKLERVGREADSEERWFLYFSELKKAMRLNVTSIRILEATWGDNSDNWLGKRVQLYWDPTVQFGGKLVGGVRIRVGRAPASTQAPQGGVGRFDPMTGRPLQAEQSQFDQNTGEILKSGSRQMADPEFDDEIPF